MEKDGAGNLAHQYTYGNERITSEGYSKLSGLYLYYGRGSVSDILGTFNEHRTSYEYTSLADVSVQYSKYGYTAQHKSFYGYNAESYSEKTGNIYLRNRFLNTKRQQFLSEDTYRGDITDPLSLNRYNYAKGNPLRYCDPSGKWSIAFGINFRLSVFFGGDIFLGVVMGENSTDGFVCRPKVSVDAGVTVSASAYIGLATSVDFRDVPVSECSNTISIGGSLPLQIGPLPCSIGVEYNLDTNTNETAGVGLNFGVGINIGDEVRIPFLDKTGGHLNYNSEYIVSTHNDKNNILDQQEIHYYEIDDVDTSVIKYITDNIQNNSNHSCIGVTQ